MLQRYTTIPIYRGIISHDLNIDIETGYRYKYGTFTFTYIYDNMWRHVKLFLLNSRRYIPCNVVFPDTEEQKINVFDFKNIGLC